MFAILEPPESLLAPWRAIGAELRFTARESSGIPASHETTAVGAVARARARSWKPRRVDCRLRAYPFTLVATAPVDSRGRIGPWRAVKRPANA